MFLHFAFVQIKHLLTCNKSKCLICTNFHPRWKCQQINLTRYQLSNELVVTYVSRQLISCLCGRRHRRRYRRQCLRRRRRRRRPCHRRIRRDRRSHGWGRRGRRRFQAAKQLLRFLGQKRCRNAVQKSESYESCWKKQCGRPKSPKVESGEQRPSRKPLQHCSCGFCGRILSHLSH